MLTLENSRFLSDVMTYRGDRPETEYVALVGRESSGIIKCYTLQMWVDDATKSCLIAWTLSLDDC